MQNYDACDSVKFWNFRNFATNIVNSYDNCRANYFFETKDEPPYLYDGCIELIVPDKKDCLVEKYCNCYGIQYTKHKKDPQD